MNNPFDIKTSFKSPKSKRVLDWDESASDTVSSVEDVHDDSRRPPDGKWLRLVLLCAFLILAGRIFFLQVVQGQNFRLLSDSNRVRSRSILAPRGLILDANRDVLAQNTASFNLVVTPFDLPKTVGEVEGQIQAAALVFNFEPAKVLEKLKSTGANSLVPIIVKQNITPEEAILFETRANEFIGFSVQSIPVRQYLNGPIFSHILGYTGIVSEQDLQTLNPDLYDSLDFTGKLGIEKIYESFLHGENGKDLVEVDASGKLLDVLGEKQPQAGQTLVLNIDKELTEQLYNALYKSSSPKSAAVVLDPTNGKVLALVSLPGFDNNLFAAGIDSKSYEQLISDKNLPLFNRVLSGTYPPGSTVKPMVAAAGLETGVIKEDTVIVDTGDLVVPNQFDPSLDYHFRGWKPGGLGPVDVRQAIAMSSDIFFYQVAGGSPNGKFAGLGPELLADYYKKFNLGSITGIDLSGEKPGVVPTPAWKAEYFKNDPVLSRWYLGDTYHVGIGQGDLLVTPLQVALWTAAIANNGTGYVPQVAQQVLDAQGKLIWKSEPKILVSNIASPQVLKIVQEGMRETVLSGTAKAMQSLPITSAGKTGTSQFDGANLKRTHAWFTAYAPYENPKIVITVLVEAGGEGNAVAEPVARQVLDWWAKNRYNH